MKFFDQVQSPISVIVGNKGAGKTLFETFLAKQNADEGRTIYANYTLNNIPYKHFTDDLLLELPEEMHNGVILIDEGHMIADAYAFLSKNAQALTTLVTQLRKRNLDLFLTTQRFSFMPKRIRQLTDFIFTVENLYSMGELLKGHSRIKIYDNNGGDRNKPIYTFDIDMSEYFDYYNTHEVIT